MVNLYLGRDSSLKKEILYNKISQNSLIIVPEHYAVTADLEIMKVKNLSGLFDINVTTFSRVFSRMSDMVFSPKESISEIGQIWMLRHILKEHREEFEVFSSTSISVGLIGEIKSVVDIFIRENVSFKSLEDLIENTKQVLLKKKLRDLLKIYRLYKEEVSNKYLIEQEILLNSQFIIETDDFFSDEIWIFGYNYFEHKQLELIKELSKTKCVNISLNYTKEEPHIYEIIKNTIKIIKDKCTSVEEIYLEIEESPKYLPIAYDLALNGKLKGNYELPRVVYARNVNEEIEWVGLDILKRTVEENITFDNFAIYYTDDEYVENIRSIFYNLSIPVYVTSNQSVIDTYVVKNFLLLLDLYKNNLYKLNLLEVLKTLSNNPQDFIFSDEIENMIRERGYRSSELKSRETFKETELEGYFNKFIKPLVDAEEFFKQERTPGEFSHKLIELMKELKVYENIGEDDEYEFNVSIDELLKEVLRQMSIAIEEKIDFLSYDEYLRAFLVSLEVGAPVSSTNVVNAYKLSSVQSHKYRHLYIVGANEGNLPKESREGTLFKEDHSNYLRANGYPTITNLYNAFLLERLNFVSVCACAEESLTLSYSSKSQDGTSLKASTYIEKLEEIDGFRQIDLILDIHAYDDLYHLNRGIEHRKVIQISEISAKDQEIKYYYDDTLDVVSSHNLKIDSEVNIDSENRYQVINTSFSRLDKYTGCPFSYFVEYELMPLKNTNHEITPILKGNIYHSFLEKSVPLLLKGEDVDFDKLYLSVVEKIDKDKILNKDFQHQYFSYKYRYDLENISKDICNEIKGKFDEHLYEQEVYGNYTDVNLTGKIDRVDVVKSDDRKIFVITDYKSSKKSIDVDEIKSGEKIQLVLYASLYSKTKNMDIAAIQYHSLKTRMNEEVAETKEVKRETPSKSRLIIEDNLDETLSSEYSRLAKNKITKKEYETLVDSVEEHVKDIAHGIKNGNRNIHPYIKVRSSEIRPNCSYCDYSCVCRFVPSRFKLGYRTRKEDE